MVRTVKVAISTTLVLVITVNLVTQQVLAVSFENSNKFNLNPSFANEIHLPQEQSKSEDHAKKNKRESITNKLNKILSNREISLKDIIEKRLEKLTDISEKDKIHIQNEISGLKVDIETIRESLKDDSNYGHATTRAKIFNDLKFYKVRGPRIHFKIELSKLKHSLEESKIKFIEIKNSLTVENDKKVQIQNQIDSVQANLNFAYEKIEKLSSELTQLELDTIKSEIRLHLYTTKKHLLILNESVFKVNGNN